MMRFEEKPYSLQELSAQLKRLYIIEDFRSNLHSDKRDSEIVRNNISPKIVLGYFETISKRKSEEPEIPSREPERMKIYEYSTFDHEDMLMIFLYGKMRRAYIKGRISKDATIKIETTRKPPVLTEDLALVPV